MSDDQVVTGLGGQSRRALLAGAGAVGVSVVLSACGTDGSGDGTAAPEGGDTTTGGAQPGGGDVLAKTADIPVGGGAIFAAKGVVVTQPTAGDFKGFSAICTHQGCPVASVDGGTINCTCHGSKFSIADGSVKTGPATKPLAAKNVSVEGDNITLA
ncbi:Rieske (2Fe-2S) protein [Micromonospora sp. NPDC049559]|uniref:Rieske (2Fe-2S) protein n=1 Tax=Micromonospora sp. NPDC049559 TaxID=3155923 RepID=UPI0034200C28